MLPAMAFSMPPAKGAARAAVPVPWPKIASARSAERSSGIISAPPSVVSVAGPNAIAASTKPP